MKKLSIAGALSAGLLILASSFTQAAVFPVAYPNPAVVYPNPLPLGNSELFASLGMDPACFTIECLIDTGQLQFPSVTLSGPYWPDGEPEAFTYSGSFYSGVYILSGTLSFSDVSPIEEPQTTFTHSGGSASSGAYFLSGGLDFTIEEPETHWICACWVTGTADFQEFSATAVPIPAAIWLFGSSLLGLGAVARKRQR